jgi:hypothetical protein
MAWTAAHGGSRMSGAKRWAPVWYGLVVWAAGAAGMPLAGQAGVGALQNVRDTTTVWALTPELPDPATRYEDQAGTHQDPVVSFIFRKVYIGDDLVALCTFGITQKKQYSSYPPVIIKKSDRFIDCGHAFHDWVASGLKP